jgi:hypothetical protein
MMNVLINVIALGLLLVVLATPQLTLVLVKPKAPAIPSVIVLGLINGIGTWAAHSQLTILVLNVLGYHLLFSLTLLSINLVVAQEEFGVLRLVLIAILVVLLKPLHLALPSLYMLPLVLILHLLVGQEVVVQE